MKKVTKFTMGFTLIALLIIGINVTWKQEAKDKAIITEINTLTGEVVAKVGDSQTLESVKAARQFIEDKKHSIIERIQLLKKSGKHGKDSELVNEFNDCRNVNIDRITNLYEKSQENLYKDLRLLNDKKEKLISTSSPKAINEINKITKALKVKIDILTELDNLIESYKSIF